MKRAVEIPAGRVLVADSGEATSPARAEPLVLLHGFTGSHESFADLVAALAPARRVLAVDLPGHGATRTGDRPEQHTMARVEAIVLAALDALEIERFSLLGYSMGGRLALHLALSSPERVAWLVLESAAPGIASAAEREERRAADERLAAAIERDGVAAFVARWEGLPLFASLALLPEERRERLRAQRLRNRAAGLAASLCGMGSGAQPWLGNRLGELGMPVLLVAGADDAKFSAIARWMALRIPRAEVAIVAGAGHLPHLEQPEIFHRVVARFLDDQPRPAAAERP